MLISVAVWQTLHSSVVGVRSLTVRGASQSPVDNVLAAAGIARGTPMVSIDAGSAVRRVEALPWVDDARVERQWPFGVVIHITERRPVAAVAAADGTWRLVDRTGRVLARLDELVAGVPTVLGAEPPGEPGSQLPPAARLALEAIARVPRPLAGVVLAAEWDASGQVTLELNDNRSVLMPDAGRLGDAYLSLSALLNSGAELASGVIDLRVPSSPVLRPPGAASIDAAVSLTPVAP